MGMEFYLFATFIGNYQPKTIFFQDDMSLIKVGSDASSSSDDEPELAQMDDFEQVAARVEHIENTIGVVAHKIDTLLDKIEANDRVIMPHSIYLHFDATFFSPMRGIKVHGDSHNIWVGTPLASLVGTAPHNIYSWFGRNRIFDLDPGESWNPGERCRRGSKKLNATLLSYEWRGLSAVFQKILNFT